MIESRFASRFDVHADSVASEARNAAEIQIGETVARLDAAIVDYVWSGVRSQPRSRIKTTSQLNEMLVDVSELTPDANAERERGGQLPKRFAQYGSAAVQFTEPSFVEEAKAIGRRWESLERACHSFFAVIKQLKKYRAIHAHPGGLPSLEAVCASGSAGRLRR